MRSQAGQPGLFDTIPAETEERRNESLERLWLLTLAAFPWGRFHSRDLHKTNAAWASYPLMPPTTADGCLAALATEERWIEGDFLHIRRLRDACPGMASLGAYPDRSLPTRTHYRAHVGSTSFNYEAHAFFSGQGVGKKIAGVQDTLCDGLWFHVVAFEPEPLVGLHEAVRGRVGPCGKKSMVQFAWTTEPHLRELVPAVSLGEVSPVAVPVLEIGSLPRTPPVELAVRSHSQVSKRGASSVVWQTLTCVWEPGQRIRAGVPIWSTREGAEISASLLDSVLV